MSLIHILKLMQIPLEDVGHLKLISKARQISYDTMEVEPADYEKWGKKFKTAGEARLGLSCDELKMEDESACSACHAALIQFLRYHTHELSLIHIYCRSLRIWILFYFIGQAY